MKRIYRSGTNRMLAGVLALAAVAAIGLVIGISRAAATDQSAATWPSTQPGGETAADMPAWAQAVMTALPDWDVVEFSRKPTVAVDSRVPLGYRLLLHKGTKERLVGVGQFRSARDSLDWEKIPHRIVHSHIDLVAVPVGVGLPERSKEKIRWEDVEQAYFAKVVYIGRGARYRWFLRAPIYWGEYLRDKLALTGGDDRIAVLIDGLGVKDKHTWTANSCADLLIRIGGLAVPQLHKALQQYVKQSDVRDALWNYDGQPGLGTVVRVLGKIPGEETTTILKGLYAHEETRPVAAYGLVQHLREGAKDEYLDMLRRRIRFHRPAKACVQFKWKEAIPILQEIFEKPRGVDEFSTAFWAKRRLEGRFDESVYQAARVLRTGGSLGPPAHNRVRRATKSKQETLDAAIQTVLGSPDREAAVVVAIDLAFAFGKRPSESVEAVNRLGRELLLKLPRDIVDRFLESIANGQGPGDEKAQKLRQWLAEPDPDPARGPYWRLRPSVRPSRLRRSGRTQPATQPAATRPRSVQAQPGWGSKGGVALAAEVANKAPIRVGDPLILRLTRIFDKPRLDQRDVMRAQQQGHTPTPENCRPAAMFTHGLALRVKHANEPSPRSFGFRPVSRKVDGAGRKYVSRDEVMFSAIRKGGRIVFDRPGTHTIVVVDEYGVETHPLSVSVAEASEPTKKALAILMAEPDTMLFMLYGSGRSDSALAAVRKVATECKGSELALRASARLGLEAFATLRKKYPSYEKWRGLRREGKGQDKELDEARAYLTEALDLPRQRKIREEILPSLLKLEYVAGDLDRALSLLKQLSEEFPDGRYGRKAAKWAAELRALQAQEQAAPATQPSR